jgi:ABC-type nitrate/sulfonate/bicarbonate transport system permease component
VLICLWYGLIKLFNLNPFFAKTPSDVWQYVTNGGAASANRSALLTGLGTTMRDAGVGFAVGTLAGCVVAVALVAAPILRASLMPLVLSVRAIPLVAMTPLIVLVFGRGLLGVSVIAGIVSFFPTLVNLLVAMDSLSRDLLDLFRSYNASRLALIKKARLPQSLPALFASARLTGPTAILGALIAEWLSTGSGLGNLMITAGVQSDYGMVWSSVVVVTLVSFVVYDFWSVVEAHVLKLYGWEQR